MKDLQEIQTGTTSIKLSSEVLSSKGIKNKKIFYTTVKKELEPNKSDLKRILKFQNYYHHQKTLA